jgi:hypothetical protein
MLGQGLVAGWRRSESVGHGRRHGPPSGVAFLKEELLAVATQHV